MAGSDVRLPSRPAEMIREVFARVHAWARHRSRRVPALSLAVGCPKITSQRRRGDPRAFCHVGCRAGKVCCSALVADLPLEHAVGLFLHELGHPMAWAAWRSSDQHGADAAVRRFLGIRLRYSGPLLIQRVPASVAERILRGRR